jgi:hypothetical protein
MSDKYKNGKIYTIRCKNDDSLIYVGSTVQPLFKRWYEHKSNINNGKSNMLLHQKIRETNIEDWYIELYQEFSCENKEQLNKREGEIIREIGTLNKLIAGRTPKEYIEDNKDKIKEYKKEYQGKNKDKIKQKLQEYYQANKDKILQSNKEYLKQYREDNKQKLQENREVNKERKKEYNKKYYEANKQL